MCQKCCNFFTRSKIVPATDNHYIRTSLKIGFSLLELVVVLAIITTLAAIAVPRYQMSLARYRADLAARRIVVDLTYAQTSAKAASSSQHVIFYANEERYELVGISPLDGDAGQYTIRLSEKPYEADITSADFGGDAQITFDGWAMPDSGGAVIINVGSEQRTITVDAETGRASIS